MLVSMNADAIIIASCSEYVREIINKCPIPVVALDAMLYGANVEACVFCDYYEGGRMAMEHLIENGCKKIVCIKGPQYRYSARARYQPEPGFVKLVLNLRYYMDQDLIVRWGEEYPIGMLDDVEIHFMHYSTCKEAKDSCDKRKARINWNKIFVIGTDRDDFDDAVYEQWKQIPYPKILFTAHSKYTEDAVCYPEYETEGQVGDLVSNRSFYKGKFLANKLEEV